VHNHFPSAAQTNNFRFIIYFSQSQKPRLKNSLILGADRCPMSLQALERQLNSIRWLEDLYTFLHTSTSSSPSPRLHIPETFVFKYQRPCAWFSTSPDGELVKSVEARELTKGSMLKTLCAGRKHARCDIVAYYVSKSLEKSEFVILAFERAADAHRRRFACGGVL
jgi:hypothetical protein